MTTLTIALHPARPTAGMEFAYACSDDGSTVSAHGTAATALLPAARRLVLVVPATMLSWHAVRLPPLASNRQRAALDGVLEDHLLDDPASLALAVGPERTADGSTLVAACDKAWLAAVLQFFEQAGRPASRVVPELAPQAQASAGLRLVAVGSADEAWLLVADRQSVVRIALAQARHLLAAPAEADAAFELLAEPAVAALAEQQLGQAPLVGAPGQLLLECGRTDWELAQFELAVSGRSRAARRWAQMARQVWQAPRWRLARWGLALALLVQLVGLNAWAWRLDAAVTERRSQVRQLLTDTFPKVRTVIDAPLQMERELAGLRQSSGALAARDLESMLSAVGGAVPEGLNPAALEFSGGQLTVKGLALEGPKTDLLKAKLAGQGYTVRAESDRLVVQQGARP